MPSNVSGSTIEECPSRCGSSSLKSRTPPSKSGSPHSISESPQSRSESSQSRFESPHSRSKSSHSKTESPASKCDSLALSDIASSASISSIASFPVYDLKASVSLAEVRDKLSQLIKTKGSDLIQACRNFDRRSTNRIPKSQLKQVIRMFCFPITAAQFDSLCEEAQMKTDGKINYTDFFSQISNTKVPTTLKTCEKIPSNLPIDEVEVLIKKKIKNNLRDVIRSFWLFDINKDGLIQKQEMRRILRNYCYDLSDEVFDGLWKFYDPKASGVVSYKEFLIKLGVSADRYHKFMPQETVASSLCWKDKDKLEGQFDKSTEQKRKWAALENRDDPSVQGMPLEEVIIVFTHRLNRTHGVLKDTFKAFDYENKGHISLNDFRGIINLFVLAMSTNLFNKVMKKLNIDVSAEGLNYNSFLEAFCKSDQSFSERKSGKKDIVCAPVVQRIKNRVLNPEARLCSVFTKINPDEEWQITRPELKKALEIGTDVKLTDEEFKDLILILDPGNTNLIKCADFIHLFEENGSDHEREPIGESSRKVDIGKYRDLSGHKLKSKLKHHLNKNFNNIEKAILVCDSDQSGFICPERLKRILSTFCFPVSDEQFDEILCGIRMFRNTVNYHEFLTVYKKAPDEDTKKWTAMVDKLVDFKSRCPPEMPVCEVIELLKDCVQSRKQGMFKEFQILDVCNVGIVCKEDFRKVLDKYAFRLTDSQFDTLYETCDRNKYNQLYYEKFLEDFSAPTALSSDAQPEAKYSPETDRSSTKGKKKVKKASVQEPSRKVSVKPAEIRMTTKEIFNSRVPQLKKLFDSIEPVITRNFRSILFHMRRADPKVTDTVEFVTLKATLKKLGIHFKSEDEFNILEYFDPYLTGKINYRDFLRIFVWYA